MYTRVSRSGGRTYLQLVEAYRDEAGKPRQRVVANLGRLDQLTPARLDPLINGLERALGRSRRPAKPVHYDASLAFGDLFALNELWDELGMGAALRRALRSSHRQFDAELLVRTMVFNRLCDPTSKLGVLRWLETVSMPGLGEEITHDQLLRAMDALMEGVAAVEEAICGQLRPLVDHTLSVVFYDLTTIRISGEGEVAGDLRRFGRRKEGGIGRQFVLGVVQSAEGLPLMHTVCEGNVSETRTLQPMLERVLDRFAVQRLIVVADRGLLSLDNIADIDALCTTTGRRIEFILAVPARRYGELAEAVIGVDAGEAVAETRFEEYRLIVAHDAAAAARQQQKRRETLEALMGEGERLAAKLDRQDVGTPSRGRRASDRGAYARFYRMVAEAEMTRFIDLDFQADLFHFGENRAAIERAEALDGKLVLITSVEDLTAAEVVSRYKSLADIERGFRVLKSDIEIAPVYHRLPERIRAHALICFLALVLNRVMRLRMKANGSPYSPQRALELLSRIQKHRVQIDGKTFEGISRIAPEQRDIFEALALPEPANRRV
jgi:hypothetical protein